MNTNILIGGGVVIVVIIVSLFLFSKKAEAPENGLDVEEITTSVGSDSALLLDVRRQDELDSDGWAAGSTHFELSRLEAGELPEVDRDTKIYTYCKSGGRAGTAKTILEDAGFANVENIGGLSDWEAAGGEVVYE